MGKILPILMLLIGTGAGIGAGLALMPAEPEPAEMADAGAEGDAHSEEGDAHGDEKAQDHGKDHGGKDSHGSKSGSHAGGHEEGPAEPDYIKLNNQFVVPVVGGDRVEALVVISLSIEAEAALREAIYSREPKIRDAFLQVLFDHSNMGGFQGAFTRSNNLDVLRTALTEVAQREFGSDVHNVLIIDIARQDV